MAIAPERIIQLTGQGDALIMPEEKRDEDTLERAPNKVGIHEVCAGFIGLAPISRTHNALICWVCHLRIGVPDTITTYGQLRAFFEKVLEAPP